MFTKDCNISDNYLLWNRFLSGDEKAYALIYEKYAKNLILQGLLFTTDRELVKDCVHDIFVKLHKNRSNLKPVNNLKEYLFIALKNSIISAITKQKINLESLDGQYEYLQITDNSSIEDDLIDKENQQRNKDFITVVLSKLTPRQREVIHYRFYENMSFDQIAVLMAMNPQSVQNLLQRSLKKLCRILKKD